MKSNTATTVTEEKRDGEGSTTFSAEGRFLPPSRIAAFSLLILGIGFLGIPALIGMIPLLPESLAFMALPFLACLILTGIHTYLGLHVIEREVIFVDLSLAQIAALGSTFAFVLGFHPGSGTSYVVSLVFTVFGAAVFAMSRLGRRGVPQEAVIGIAYACATAITLLLISRAPHGAEHIKEMLTGSILWVDEETIVKTARIYSVVGVFHVLLFRVFTFISHDPRGAASSGLSIRTWDFLFYLSFGFVITSSVAVAGVLLVFAFLVIPSVLSALFTRRTGVRLLIGWLVGTTVSVLGLIVSYTLDFSSGPAVVTILGISLGVTALGRVFAARRGGGMKGRVRP